MEIDSGSAAQVQVGDSELGPPDVLAEPASAQPTVKVVRSPLVIALACICAYLLPGAGHLVLGKWKRAATFFLAVSVMFWQGLRMHGHLFLPSSDDWLSYFPAFANAGSGLLYVGSWISGIGLLPVEPLAAFNQAGRSSFEYGNTFLMVSGLLNYLLMLDTFDIAVGRKQ